MAPERHGVAKASTALLFFVILMPTPISGEDFILPILYMPLKKLLPGVMPNVPADFDKVTAEHVREHEKWSNEEVYAKTIRYIGKRAIIWISIDGGKLPGSNFDSKWFYKIPFLEVNSTYSNESNMEIITPSDIQEKMLHLLSRRFIFDLNNVASHLNVPVANLSESYDPANWEAVVHAMVEESILTFISRLELGSVESLAKLVRLTVHDLKNSTLGAYESLVPPLYPKKLVLDHNTTSTIAAAPGITPTSPEDTVVTKLVTEATNFTADDFGVLYNFTDEQVKTLTRTNFFQISRMCNVTVPTLMNMTLPHLSWSIVGSKFVNPPCLILVTIKGKSISTLAGIDFDTMSVLDMLTATTDLPWRKVFWAVNASMSDWELLASVTIQQLLKLSGKGNSSLLDDSLSDLVELIYTLNENGSLGQAISDHRNKVRSSLESMFNLTTGKVAGLIGISEGQLQNSSSSNMVNSFLNATVSYFNITWNDIYGPAKITLQELDNLPQSEWTKIIRYIIKAALKLEAIKLQMSEDILLKFLDITPENATIANIKWLIKTRIQVTLGKKDKFENQALQVHLSASSVSDEDYLNSSVLALLFNASGFNTNDFQLVYNVDPGQVFILQQLKFKDLALYCGFSGTSIKQRTPFNITAELVGIKTTLATCKTTGFYAGSKSKPLSSLQEQFPILKNTTVSFVRSVEEITGLSWRRNLWPFGVKMEDWTTLDSLSITKFGEVTSQSIPDVQKKTLQSIFDSALQLKAADNVKLRTVHQEYRTPTLNELFRIFKTAGSELITVLTITQSRIDASTLPEVAQLTLTYYREKFNVSLVTLGNKVQVAEKDLHKMAPTEWHELVQPLKDEIIRSGRIQLGVSLQNFSDLLGHSSEEMAKLDLSQLKTLWNTIFIRLRKGKNFVEEKTISQLTTLLNLDQRSFWDMNVMAFMENLIGLKKAELVLLYSFNSDGLDVLTNYTFMDVSTTCGLTKAAINGTTPLALIKSLLGVDSPMGCRPVALAVAARTMTLQELSRKFNTSVNDSESFLLVVEKVIPLPWSKIAWALDISLSRWPSLGAVSLKDLADIRSDTPSNIKSQKSLRAIASDIVVLNGSKFDTLLSLYRLDIIQKVSQLFAVNSTEVCNSCSMDIVDIFDKMLKILSAKIDFLQSSLPPKMEMSGYEFKVLPPSVWWRAVPLIVADSYERASSSLGISKDRLSILFGSSFASILNMTLENFVPVMEGRIKPLIKVKVAMQSKSLTELADLKGVPVSGLEDKNIVEVITTLVSDVPLSNISFVFMWNAENISVLQNYTLGYAAKYKPGGFNSLKSMTLFDLVQFISGDVHGVPLPTTQTPSTRPSCREGYVLQEDNMTCIGKQEFLVSYLHH